MSEKFSRIKGFADFFEPESLAYTHIEANGRKIFSRYGFQELRTPIPLYCHGQKIYDITVCFQQAVNDVCLTHYVTFQYPFLLDPIRSIYPFFRKYEILFWIAVSPIPIISISCI